MEKIRKILEVFVPGTPVPKQSFRFHYGGKHYIDPRTKKWQQIVSEAVRGKVTEPIAGPIRVYLIFNLPTRRRMDPDNLSKNILDSLNKIVWVDDSQIEFLCIKKNLKHPEPGVKITVLQ
jgi:Holliday junction resolvase RusA-like endonuclease